MISEEKYLENLAKCEQNILNSPFGSLTEDEFSNIRSYYPSIEETERAINIMLSKKIDKNKIKVIGLPKIVIVMAPPASGKSALNEYSIRKMGDEPVLINSDEIKLYCPRASEIANHPTIGAFYTYITDIFSNLATSILLDKCLELRLSIVFECTGKNDRILKTLERVRGYRIKIRVMGVSPVTCLVSIMGRYSEQRLTGCNVRLVRADDFLKSYENLPLLLNSAEHDYGYFIEVFTRGQTTPIKLYSSNDRQGYRDAATALSAAREYNGRVSREQNMEKIATVNRFLHNKASESTLILTEFFNIMYHIIRLDQTPENDDF